MLSSYLPAITAAIVAIITFVGNYYIGKLKSNIDAKALVTTASDALRDDLLQVIDRYEKREQFLVDRVERNETANQTLQTTITQLRTEISDLRIENQGLKVELQQTRSDLAQFERKVYYIPPKPEVKPE